MNRVFAMRFVLVLVGGVFISLISLSGCGIVPTDSPDAMATNASGTLTALAVSPTSTATLVPKEKPIVDALNMAFGKDAVVDDLTRALDAYYQVASVSFNPERGEMKLIQIDMRCICVRNANCCVPERAFVTLAHAMKAIGKQMADALPSTIEYVQVDVKVACQNNICLVGVVSVPWCELKKYIVNSEDQINGYQLGSQTTISHMP